MTISAPTGSVAEAMTRLQRMIGDDYVMRATTVGDALVDVEVIPRDAACEECLVPKDVLRDVADLCLTDSGYRVRELRYPGESRDEAEPCRQA